jgi:cytoskeletal protein CcmA (bactofilin family)
MIRLSVSIILSILFLIPSFAAEYRTGDLFKVEQYDTLYNDIFAGCRQADIFGVVKGDVYAGCQVLTLEGEIEDDLWAGCRSLEVRGTVRDNVFGFAGTILIDSDIGGDVIAYGGTVRITERASIKGNLFVGSGQLFLDGGQIGGNIKGGAGQIHLNGVVKGRVELGGNKVTFGPNYQAKDGTQLTLESELDREKMDYIPSDLEVIVKEHKYFYHSIFFFWFFLSLLIVGIIIIALLKNFSLDYITHVRKNPLQDLGLGFLIVIVTPIVLLVLLILILTIPVGLILSAVYFILLYISIIFASLFSGDYILKLFKKNGKISLFWPLLIGIVIYVLLIQIPLVGFLVSLIVISFGSGSLISYIWQLRKPAESSVE